jgi:hypothetical protein
VSLWRHSLGQDKCLKVLVLKPRTILCIIRVPTRLPFFYGSVPIEQVKFSSSNPSRLWRPRMRSHVVVCNGQDLKKHCSAVMIYRNRRRSQITSTRRRGAPNGKTGGRQFAARWPGFHVIRRRPRASAHVEILQSTVNAPICRFWGSCSLRSEDSSDPQSHHYILCINILKVSSSEHVI